MLSVRAIAEEIVAREGGYVNDPDDPGGATN
ncbi:MAG: glycosyl hydrolase 108 family protein, partial [Jannaschia helgolandensis]